MATKKQKRARALAKHEAFMAKYRADGLAAQKAAREHEARREEEMRRRAVEIDRQHREIIKRELAALEERVRKGDNSGLTNREIEYIRARCERPHADGSKCRPTWDGVVYICFHALLEETTQAMLRGQYEQAMENHLQRMMQTVREHPLIPGDPNAK